MNKVDMADVCELAHELTARECNVIGIILEKKNKEGVEYTPRAQEIFNEIYDLITNILNV